MDCKSIDQALRHCAKFAPELVPLRASLLPFEDVIIGCTAGPQPDAEDYTPGEEPFFIVDIDDAANARGETWARVTSSGVTISYTIVSPDGKTYDGDDIQTTMHGLWGYLRQLPRSAGSFFSNRQDGNA